MGTIRSRRVFVLAAGSTSSGRGLRRTCHHWSVSSSPLRQPVSSAAWTMAAQPRRAGLQQGLGLVGFESAPARSFSGQANHGFGPVLERGSRADEFGMECPPVSGAATDSTRGSNDQLFVIRMSAPSAGLEDKTHLPGRQGVGG